MIYYLIFFYFIEKNNILRIVFGFNFKAPQYKDARRSSNDSTGRLSSVKLFSHGNIKMQAKALRAPHEIDELLDLCMDWEFDIFKLEVLSGMRFV